MSTTILKLIPNDPFFVPDPSLAQQAKDLLARLISKTGAVDLRFFEQIRFIDPGQNLERIICPVCDSEISVEWWQQAMGLAYQSDFQDLTVELPCCRHKLSLNNLQYVWPAGFARFVLEVRNPVRDLSQSEFMELENILNCKLRKIKAYY